MTLENKLRNIAKKVKQIAMTPITKNNMILIGGLSLASLVGCESQKAINPLAPSVDYSTSQTTGLKFTPDKDLYGQVIAGNPRDKVEAVYTAPNNQVIRQELTDDDNDNVYRIDVSSTPAGTHKIKYILTSGGRETKTEENTTVYNLSEAETDSALQQIIAPMVKPGSTTDGDIIAASYNQNHFFGGALYNNDCEVTIYDSTAGGNQRDYIIDVQGLISDAYNPEKHADATSSSISYNNIGAFSSTSSLESIINNLQSTGWTRTF